MKLSKYAFIMRDPSFEVPQSAQVDSPAFAMTVYGVGSMEQACDVAKELVAGGIQLIELCGAFKGEQIEQVITAIDGKVPVGHMEYSDVERKKLVDFFNS
ncbi:Uncharacterised protein [Phocoenobacter uteri]|uniref:Uncharacterized protein n=1 Tax=Phocoenobacter uteri TaxID=146806 RepID=A0A379C8V1_9PAST|nr:DUF6506 family protein [Phocoenobacter uteri]MDG6882531.1 hypothetical protein [Phocoenobacter uteri]SUB58694.1 Uncharacterised protein [Phocoenobacter uteri]